MNAYIVITTQNTDAEQQESEEQAMATDIIMAFPTSSQQTLKLADIQNAYEQYDEFVQATHVFGQLSLQDFRIRRQMPLNAQCAQVFLTKTSHLTENDFIEIDRPVLNAIGFKNNWIQQKDKHGNVKVDEDGIIKLKDTRADFGNAIKCLRNTVGFKEGSSLDDNEAHFVLEKAAGIQSHGGHNKQKLWICMRAFEHFVIMANTENSCIVRDFFIDLKNLVVEFSKYEIAYRAWSQLKLKDDKIDMLGVMIQEQSRQLNEQTKQLNELLGYSKETSTKLTSVISLVEGTKHDVVVPADNDELQEIVIIMTSDDKQLYVVSCVQKRNKKVTIRNNRLNHADKKLDVIHIIDCKPNAKNLLHRFKEYVTANELSKEIKFSGTSFTLSSESDLTTKEIVSIFEKLSLIHHTRVLRASK